VITGLGYQSRVAIQFLEELATEWSSQFAADAKKAAENSLNKKSKKTLQAMCKKYEDPGNVDKALKVIGQVDKVKGQMQDNIANMLKNTEQAESLAEKSDQLNEQASVFKKNSKTLKKQMAWKNLKMTLILGGVVAIILIVILVPLIMKLKG
jgi:CHASE3 domain sensor protein